MKLIVYDRETGKEKEVFTGTTQDELLKEARDKYEDYPMYIGPDTDSGDIPLQSRVSALEDAVNNLLGVDSNG